jgi:hypothetical protein
MKKLFWIVAFILGISLAVWLGSPTLGQAQHRSRQQQLNDQADRDRADQQIRQLQNLQDQERQQRECDELNRRSREFQQQEDRYRGYGEKSK